MRSRTNKTRKVDWLKDQRVVYSGRKPDKGDGHTRRGSINV